MKKLIFLPILLITLFISIPCFCDQTFPIKEWKPKPDPIADKDASIGGELSICAGQYPKSLNYYLDNNSITSEIFSAMYETLLRMNSVTLEYEPWLASKWSISDDKKTFIFYLNKKACWSDKTPITAHDVKWTYETIMNPKNLTGPNKVSMERFYPPEILDDYTIRFKAKDVHWKNLISMGLFHILPKKAFEKKDFNKINFEFPVVSGPYKLGKIEEGVYLTLERRSNWWNINDIRVKGTGNFQTLKFKFFAERENAFEAFKKGLLDLFPVYTSRLWINQTKGEKFEKNWIVKQKVYNKSPIGFQGFAMNMRRSPFDDIKVRKAMAMLIDRRKLNKTLMYDQYFLHKSYLEDIYDQKTPCPNPLIELDKKQAKQLLNEAGWLVNEKTGFREKNGQKFSFKFLNRDASSEKFLSVYAENLKDAGIELIIDKKDWAAWARDMDEFNFDMTWASWGALIFKDLEGMWSSKEATRKSGNNITGFQNKTVDSLIEKQRKIFDINKRNKINRQIDQIIYNAYPYVLLWNIDYTRLLYWNKFGTPKTVLSKYAREESAYWYWWLDPDSKDDLEDAMKNKTLMPFKQLTVRFDDIL